MESESSQRSGGGGNPGEQGAGGVRETGEERAGSGISAMGGKQDRNSKRQAFVVCYCRIIQSKKRTQQQPPLPRPRAPPPRPQMNQDSARIANFIFLSFVRSLAVSVLFVVLFFFLLPLPF